MYQRVLVPLDGSEVAECAISHMQAVASGCNVTDVVLLRVLSPLMLPGDYFFSESDRARMEAEHRAAAESYMEEMRKRVAGSGLNVQAVIIEEDAAEGIVEYARRNNIDMIIMATHGRSGIGRWALGSVADRVVRHAGIPVLLVRASKDACSA
jgi:nucleotide-binding universal stress UspA family protein